MQLQIEEQPALSSQYVGDKETKEIPKAQM